MKKTLLVLLSLSVSFLAMSQTTTSTTTSTGTKLLDLSKRAADHFVFQFGYDNWTNRPDSVRTTGFGRHFNFYFMLDKPFKSNQKISIAYGVGFSSSNIFFENTYVDVKSNTLRLPFTAVDSVNHFDKFKITTFYAELPVELRYYSNPENPNKSWKGALGFKLGTLLKSYSKAKNLVTKNGVSVYGDSYIAKESNKRFFNGTMLAFTGRVGYGFLSIDAGYQFNGVLKEGTGAAMNKFSIGLTVSGL
jgi:hypothetical protein